MTERLKNRQDVALSMISALTNFQLKVGSQDSFIEKQIKELNVALEESNKSEKYKIAVVGSFKVGKSSFINRLFDVDNLASVDTNPETATVTSFQFSENTTAEIRFMSKKIWQEMRKASKKDPSDLLGRRFTGWEKKLGEIDDKSQIDFYNRFLDELEENNNKVKSIKCLNWEASNERKNFRKELKKYISSRNPLHYLVERVSVFAPIPILQLGIELIDTPGLNDPDLYRVRATEQEVENVDAILFLTTSGASYSQSDKEFLLTQIRKRRLQHLRIIITKYDITYENACRQSEEEDEDRPTLVEHFHGEEIRVRGAIKDTLDEILNVSDSQLGERDRDYFHNLLDDIKVHFVSSNIYADGNHKESGIPQVREDIIKMIKSGEFILSSIILLDRTILRVAQATRNYISDYKVKKSRLYQKNREEEAYAETQQLASSLLRKFEKQVERELHRSREFDDFDKERIKSEIKMVGVRSQDVIDAFEARDSFKHWRTKRSGDWLYLHDFANKVANRIFPEFEATIRRYQRKSIDRLGIGVKQAKQLQDEIKRFTSSNPLVNEQMQDLISNLRENLNFDESELDIFFDTEQHLIIDKLESFIDQETYDLIEESRSRVAIIEGRGTSLQQNKVVKEFYDEFSMIIRPRLEKYLFESFYRYTNVVTDRVFNIFKSINRDIEQRLQDQKQIIRDITQRQKNQELDLVIPAFTIIEEAFDNIEIIDRENQLSITQIYQS